MLRALCTHLGVRDATKLVTNGEIAAGDETRYSGVVSRFEHGWGFIECEAMNRNFFVHFSDIEGTGLRSLEAGDAVSFEIAPGKDGRPKAIRVRRQGSRPTARTSRIEAIPRAARAGRNGDQGLPSDEELDEALALEHPNAQ
jgi:CspA family cold shock protein